MKQLKRYLDVLKDGFQTHSRSYAIMRKYEKPCAEASAELEQAGITIEDWRRLRPGYDPSFLGVLYSLGGTASWIRHGLPE